jgi:hypothetical protein
MSAIDQKISPPDQVIQKNDPGDETARRYRFQYAWSAIVCCALLDDTQDVIEVFCEHHEDILIKHGDGRFTGIQVKTRESDQPPWKAGEEPVRNAIARFVRLEVAHPGYFRAFQFVTNHPLYSSKNSQSIVFLLGAIKSAPTVADLPSGVGNWLARIAKEANATQAVAFQTLKKCSASDSLPKLQDATMRLVEALVGCWAEAANCTHASVRSAAQTLIDHCSRAASLDHLQLLPAYLAATDRPEAELLARINGKCMTARRIQTILDQGMNATAPLAGEPSKQAYPGQGSAELLLKKLDAGGFSAVSRNSATDLRDKADYLALTWTKKLGRTKGLERYDHIRSVALSDAARAFEATCAEEKQFGPTMREDLRGRFQTRRTQGDQLFDCSNEHLEGFAYSLTAECQVQWSIDRPWEDG